MENYFSQLLSRNAPADPGLLQPDSLAMPQGNGYLEESLEERLPVNYESTEKAEDVMQPDFQGFEHDSQPYIEQKNIHHHYLKQYFTRVVSEEAEKELSPASIIKQNEKQFPGIEPDPNVSNRRGSDKREAQDMLQIVSVKEVAAQMEPTVHNPPLLRAESGPKASGLVPTLWLLPPPPAVKAAPLQTPSTNKPAPSLMIGRILIELLPAKPAPTRAVNRSSPFQATAGKSSSSSIAFGLGQL